MKIFGLTGGIACGKSTVSGRLRKLGIPVIDADVLARQAVAPGTLGFKDIVKEFGVDIVGSDGQLDRPKLGKLVFSDEKLRNKVNSIVHPRVRELFNEEAMLLGTQKHKLVCYDCPLLFESSLDQLYRPTIVVACSSTTQIYRLRSRNNLSFEGAVDRISAQMHIDEKVKKADFVIWNDNITLDQLHKEVDFTLKYICNYLKIDFNHYIANLAVNIGAL